MEFANHFPTLLNLLGHAAGITAFGAFLILLARLPRSDIRVPAVAAALALCWNLGSLAVLLAAPEGRFQGAVAALSLAFLSLLPCTLLHLALGSEYRWLAAAGYAVGAVAAVIHATTALGAPVAPTEAGIAWINYGFGSLSIIGAVLLARAGPRQTRSGMRALAAMALFLLALSFVHFGRGHESGPWLHELAIHHAGIPLSLFVLLQDYRFLLMDVFARRTGSVLLAAALAGMILWAADLLGLVRATAGTDLELAVFLVVSGLAILAYPAIATRFSAWSENRIFGRKDVQAANSAIAALEADSEESLLAAAAGAVAKFASAAHWKLLAGDGFPQIPKSDTLPAPCLAAAHSAGHGWGEAAVPLRDGAGAQCLLLLGAREGGRRYLSIDLADLDLLAATVARRVEAMRREERDSLLRDAEIATLRAQINPHFLFNALNALNASIPSGAADARKTLLNLADIFRYSLNSKQQLVSLADELDIIEAYLQIERLRLMDRLTTHIDVDERARFKRVPALSIQPLVENAVKHGVSRLANGGEIRVTVREAAGGLSVEVRDNGPGFDSQAPAGMGHGLRSVERRLQLCYGSAARFRTESDASGSRVGFTVPAAANGRPANAARPAADPAGAPGPSAAAGSVRE
ncbi:MAG: histidine kinase [Bryobacterales bacterium]|nr:histidine kinase [Bryobacterales bacterium]